MATFADDRADALRALHVPGRPVVLPNAWDAASARLVEAAGFSAVATSSGAVARCLGFADGEHAPASEMFAAATRIARAVEVPVSVDLEGGYGIAAPELAQRLAQTGAVGANLEDTDHAGGRVREPQEQAERLAALRSAAGPAVVLNARIDLFLRATDHAALLDEATRRARAYLDAGADCVYPIGLRDPRLVEAFAASVAPAAVNVLAPMGGPEVGAYATLGVARVSLGTGLWDAEQEWLAERLTAIASGDLR